MKTAILYTLGVAAVISGKPSPHYGKLFLDKEAIKSLNASETITYNHSLNPQKKQENDQLTKDVRQTLKHTFTINYEKIEML